MRNPITTALNLRDSGIFRLLVITTALLSGVIALGAGSAGALQNLYSAWQLSRSQSLTVYLPPETEPTQITQLTQALPTLAGVTGATQIGAGQLQIWLQPLVSNTTNLPLPAVVEVTFKPDTPLEPVTDAIHQAFPTAEIDDHQPLLQQVGSAVRNLQMATLALSATMLALMALLITLTTRTGLQAHTATLHLLVQLGSTDSTLTRSVISQVVGRALGGYLLGTGVAAALLAAATRLSTSIALYVTPTTWAALAIAPLLLPLVAALATLITTQRLLHRLT